MHLIPNGKIYCCYKQSYCRKHGHLLDDEQASVDHFKAERMKALAKNDEERVEELDDMIEKVYSESKILASKLSFR